MVMGAEQEEQHRVEKTWGYEIWFANNDLYCGKLISVNKGKRSSKGRYHYHKIKDETFYVIEGTLLLVVKLDGVKKNITLKEGDRYRILPTVKHKFTAVTDICKFIEFSTQHFDEDSYRVCDHDYKPDENNVILKCTICGSIIASG